MPYSLSVKNEAAKTFPANNDGIYAELSAVFRYSGTYRQKRGNVFFEVPADSPALAKRIMKLTKDFYDRSSGIDLAVSGRTGQDKKYRIRISDDDVLNDIAGSMKLGPADGEDRCAKLPDRIISNKNKRMAYIKGAFLAAGSVSNPRKTYHMEIKAKNRLLADESAKILNSLGANPKILDRRASSAVYIKEGDQIINFLGIIGAYSHLMEFENIRIMKEMRNNVNRIVNCETSNLDKTVDAGVRQLEDIKLIDTAVGLESLPKPLCEIARLRLVNEDLSLLELSRLTKDGIGKSGVRHRMEKISQIAQDIREKKSEKSDSQEDRYI
jgi:cell division protein WhiA